MATRKKKCPLCGEAMSASGCATCANALVVPYPPSSMGVGMAHETHFTTHPLPREDRVPCPNCRGEGQIAFMTGSSPPQECTLCQGTGVKPAIKAFVVKGKVTVNAYAVITRAVEEGVRYGWMRAHKHVDKPDEHQMCQEMENGVMNALCEVLNWGDEDEEA